MKKIYLSLLITLLSAGIHAQVLDFVWAKSTGGVSADVVHCITTDGSGNVYTTGEFYVTVDFDPSSAGTFNMTSNGLNDIFIQKLDANGNFIWAKSIGGSSSEVGQCITTDASGNVYITGSFAGTVDFNPGAGTFNLTSNFVSQDIYVLKLDANGNFIWAKSIGEMDTDFGQSIITDASGNVLITGSYQLIVDFNPGAGTFYLTSNGQYDVFVLKLDANGNFMWAKSMGGPFGDWAESIAVDALGNVLITGAYKNTVDFDPGAGIFNLTSNGDYDIFIQKMDAAGIFIWAKSMGGPSGDFGASIVTDTSSNVLLTGTYRDTTDFDPDTSTLNLVSNGGQDIFIQKLDAGGSLIWAKSMGGTGMDHGVAVSADTSGNILITGYYWGTADFDPGAATFNLTSNGSQDIFVLKLDAGGNFILAKSIGGTDTDIAWSITIDALQNVYVAGRFQGTVDFDPGAATFNLISNGIYPDFFVLKLSHITVSVEENTWSDNVIIFPNPSSGLVNLDLGKLKKVTIKVFNVVGKLVYQAENINTSIHRFELNETPGLYIIKVSSQGERQQYKLVKM
ncbi:MAG: T9SS type A sorting domain-containing protein [Bacteroidetes bacterium]|nr:T9SS type A sorting domain-containing protein [Bacteroidota bacterium]